jgi:hypothetical protein
MSDTECLLSIVESKYPFKFICRGLDRFYVQEFMSNYLGWGLPEIQYDRQPLRHGGYIFPMYVEDILRNMSTAPNQTIHGSTVVRRLLGYAIISTDDEHFLDLVSNEHRDRRYE